MRNEPLIEPPAAFSAEKKWANYIVQQLFMQWQLLYVKWCDSFYVSIWIMRCNKLIAVFCYAPHWTLDSRLIYFPDWHRWSVSFLLFHCMHNIQSIYLAGFLCDPLYRVPFHNRFNVCLFEWWIIITKRNCIGNPIGQQKCITFKH